MNKELLDWIVGMEPGDRREATALLQAMTYDIRHDGPPPDPNDALACDLTEYDGLVELERLGLRDRWTTLENQLAAKMSGALT